MKLLSAMVRIGRLLMYALAVLSTGATHAEEFDVSPRIVGGSLVAQGSYPFMAAVYFDPDGDGRFVPGCGGSLISPSWVLTAAHCLRDEATGFARAPSTIAIFIGNTDLTSDEGDFVLSTRIILHPEYDPATNIADIALIQLAEPVFHSRLTLPTSRSGVPTVGETAVVAGWGVTSEGGTPSSDLLEVALPIVSHAQCIPFYLATLDADANFCAGGGVEIPQDSCQGDSGGPIFVLRDDIYVQAGIVSYGNGCARPGIPGVYTRVTTYVDWINRIVNEDLQLSDTPSQNETTNPIGSDNFPQLFPDTPLDERVGNLSIGDAFIYEVSGNSEVTLNSRTGDADLYVMQGLGFTRNDVVCSSISITVIDQCILEASNQRLFAVVYAYVDSTYEISVTGPDGPVDDEPGTSDESRSSGGAVDVGAIFGLMVVFYGRRRLLKAVTND